MTAASWRTRGVALLFIVFTVPGCIELWQMARAETLYTAVTTELSFWRRQGYQAQADRVTDTQARITRALELYPSDPRYLQAGAELMRWRARWAEDPQSSTEYFERSLQLQWQALTVRPAQLSDWQRFLRDKARAGAFDDDWQRARQQLLALDRSR